MIGPQAENMEKLKGIAASPGIIIGKARLVDRNREKILYEYLINEKQAKLEVDRFKEALNKTRKQLSGLKKKLPENIKKQAYILDTHQMILKDSMLADATVSTILNEKINAEWALKKSIENIKQVFEAIEYEYIRDRIVDVEHVGERILRNLSGKGQESLSEISERVIIVARDLSPADTSELNLDKVMGFITDVGGRTSHTAIMAQAMNIPAVVALEKATQSIQEGSLLIVDGYSGEVIIHPDDETIIVYQEKQLQHERYLTRVGRVSHLPAETMDGHRLTIKANIEFAEEVAAVRDHGAEGVGLYRTEFHYLRSKGIPDEEELFEDYKEVAEILNPEPVTIRSLDLGGDKFASELNLGKEMNPALGLRAIRFSLKRPEIFKSQLRAIYRASSYGNLRLMFPMISGLREILEIKVILNEVRQDLDRSGMAYNADMPIGIMIEIPSAVAVADILAKNVDFFSIGTNDLIQYSLAIDRVNEHLTYMYQPFHPAIIRLIDRTVQAAHGAGITCALCGEMAGDPLCTIILLGLGIDELSLNAASIPIIKQIVRSLGLKEARECVKDILELNTATEVKEYLIKRMEPFMEDLVEKDFLLKTAQNNRLH
jgi:phosphotransferase system enzyme I (PtsI)